MSRCEQADPFPSDLLHHAPSLSLPLPPPTPSRLSLSLPLPAPPADSHPL